MKRVLLGAASAILLVLAFPPYSITSFLFFGFIPLFFALYLCNRWQQAFLVGCIAMFFYTVFGFPWVGDVAVEFGGLPWIVGKIVLVLFSLFGELQILAFSLVFFYFVSARKKKVRFQDILGLAFVYTALDWTYPKIFPNTMGHALITWESVVQISEYSGAYGLTILILIANLSLFVLSAGFYFKEQQLIAFRKPALTILAGVTATFFVFFLWGGKRFKEIEDIEKGFKRTFSFSLIQPNIEDSEKTGSEGGSWSSVTNVLKQYREQTLKAVSENPATQLVLWPETAFPLLYIHFDNPIADKTAEWGRGVVRDIVETAHRPLYFGGYAARGTQDFNTGFLVDETGNLLDYYNKSVLLAFGEYVPLGPLSKWVQDLIPSIANFGRGPGPKLISFRGIKLGPQICYEGLLPYFSREAVKKGADILLNITNDSWFGKSSEPYLHLALTRFRSIELRRPMVRSTNSGISAFIDATGRVKKQTPLFENAILHGQVAVPGEGQSAPQTFYLRFGEVFGYLACAMSLLSLISLASTVRRKTP